MYSKEEERDLYELSKKFLETSASIKLFNEITQDEIENLRRVIRYHDWRYYVGDTPVISDFEYDQLYKQLERLEASRPELMTPDSPTQRVGKDLVENFEQVEHLTTMLSLENSYSPEDLLNFDIKIKKICGLGKDVDIEYCLEPKFDGGTIVLVYENDSLLRGATRGDGLRGDNISANIRTLRSIPLQASFSKLGIIKAELRGEALIRKDIFEKINKKRAGLGESVFANPRNAATGSLRMKDPREVASRGLEAFIYQLSYAVNKEGNDIIKDFITHDQTINFLSTLGFKVPLLQSQSNGFLPERKICRNIDEAVSFCKDWQNFRDKYPYEIDGMVLKVNHLELQSLCGYTSHHPRWAVAFKFKAQQAVTHILDVNFQVGKTGAITPIARLKPVQIGGVKVSNVTLHNEEFMINKDIRERDLVLVERSGDVIPHLVKVMVELRNGNERQFKYPQRCPSCESELVKPINEAIWRCENAECPAQVVQRMIFHTSKHAMDIEGMGESTILRFYKLGWLHSIADIYRLDYEKIAQLEGFGEKSAANLRNAVEKARQNPIHRLLHSLSIHHLGQKASKLLAAEVEHVLDLANWEPERYEEIKDVGPVLARNVYHFFHNEHNIALLQTMEQLGVNLRQKEEDKKPQSAAEGPLAGKTILFTGTLGTMTREEAEARAAAAGAGIASGVSKNLSILVVGEKAGSKLKKAQALGTVEIWTEDQFLLNLSE